MGDDHEDALDKALDHEVDHQTDMTDDDQYGHIGVFIAWWTHRYGLIRVITSEYSKLNVTQGELMSMMRLFEGETKLFKLTF